MQEEWSFLWNAALNPERLAGMRIMVVEDDLCLQTMLTRLLRRIDMRCEVLWCTTAEDALAALDADQKRHDRAFDLIIADIGLPGRNSGIDLWEICRIRFPQIAIFLMSGKRVDEFLGTMGRRRDLPAFLPKPFSVEECQTLVRKLLDVA